MERDTYLTGEMIQRCEELHEMVQQLSKAPQAEWKVKPFART